MVINTIHVSVKVCSFTQLLYHFILKCGTYGFQCWYTLSYQFSVKFSWGSSCLSIFMESVSILSIFLYPAIPSFIRYCCPVDHTFLKSTFYRFLTLASLVVSLQPIPSACLPPVSFLSISFSIFLSLSLLCWSLWLILKGKQESEWDLKESEELCSTQQGRPSLDWNAASAAKNTTHGRRELFPHSPFLFPPPLYSSLSSLLSCLISHFHSPSAGARI